MTQPWELQTLIRDHAPPPVHSMAISAYNSWQYVQRRSGQYSAWRRYFDRWWLAPEQLWRVEQQRRLQQFLDHARARSPFHAARMGDDLASAPLLTKDELRTHLDQIATVPESRGRVSYTGGTTGASLKVIFTPEDLQQRWATVDDFRARFGYRLGRRTAWFGGRDMLSHDTLKRHAYRDNYLLRIRFFSTFHINDMTFRDNWAAFTAFGPEYLVGYPSSVYELCRAAYERGWTVPTPARAFFATAETLVAEQVAVIEAVLGCRVVNQYASSEGAPFIVECPAGGLHLHPLTGIFEQVDGELVVTSFSTRGTPLIRYRIGDRITLAAESASCACGSSFPVVASIDGRASESVWSAYNGSCNAANVSTSTKGIPGIVAFQVIQDEPDAVRVLVVPGPEFGDEEQARFVQALRRRIGPMRVEVLRVPDIPVEASGKRRLIKNNLV